MQEIRLTARQALERIQQLEAQLAQERVEVTRLREALKGAVEKAIEARGHIKMALCADRMRIEVERLDDADAVLRDAMVAGRAALNPKPGAERGTCGQRPGCQHSPRMICGCPCHKAEQPPSPEAGAGREE